MLHFYGVQGQSNLLTTARLSNTIWRPYTGASACEKRCVHGSAWPLGISRGSGSQGQLFLRLWQPCEARHPRDSRQPTQQVHRRTTAAKWLRQGRLPQSTVGFSLGLGRRNAQTFVRQHLPQRRQAGHNVLPAATVAHESNAPDFAC